MITNRNNNDIVEVFCGSSWEAELVKGLLESNGIICMIKSGSLSSYTQSLGDDYAVMVNKEDSPQAIDIINNRTEVDGQTLE